MIDLWWPFLILLLAAGSAGIYGRFHSPTLSITRLSWLLALGPLAALIFSLYWLGLVAEGTAVTWQIDWLPALGLSLGFYFDSLSGLFALLVTGIGTLVILYSGSYFQGDDSAWRFLAYLLLFMVAMLGLVMAGDVITLFIFWEATSILSFLLVAYKYKYEAARQGAFRAFLITAGGGVALLLGLLLVSQVAGGSDWQTILAGGEALRASPVYLLMLSLVAVGAFTKSAQTPFHIWLPGAMSAPTPASAYLHSATMVKAGIYLMARLNPALGQTESWFWLLTLVGMATMLTGAYLGLKQNDLKALLAYSTISQLGILMMLIGQDTDIAFKALVIGVVAHAFYKSALFLIAGSIDHETGTRDLRHLGGLRRAMPFTFAVAVVAALSMAGLPPLFGFLAKETLLATAVHPSLPAFLAWIFPASTVIAGSFILVQASLLIGDVFLGQPRTDVGAVHEAPQLMWLAPAVPAALSLALGLLPEPKVVANLLANAAAAAYGDKVKVSLALWTGLNIPLLLSAVAIGLGTILTIYRHPLRARLAGLGTAVSLNRLWDGGLAGVDWLADGATRGQHGRLRFYLAIILLTTAGLVFGLAGLGWAVTDLSLTWPALTFDGELVILRLFALLVTVGAALASVFLRRDLFAVMAFGLTGLGTAVYMILEPAPDVALVQIVVDIMAMVILVLALTRLPRAQRRAAQRLYRAQSRPGLLRDGIVAGSLGLVVTLITLTALTSRPRQSVVTPFYEANAKILTGAKDIVGAIIVDYRALDTLIEITVFGLAGLGLYTLLRYAARQTGDDAQMAEVVENGRFFPTSGIGGSTLSSFIRALATISLPLSLVVGVTHMMYGHDQPGDGFTAGVIISLAVGFWYVVFGYEETRRRLGWLRPFGLIAAGLLLVIGSGTTAALMTGSFLGHVDFGKLWGLPLPDGFSLSTAFLFEVAICLAVLGSVVNMLNGLGHPERAFVKRLEIVEDSMEVSEDRNFRHELHELHE
jgi:NADH:ubiquinone oxidoreductase subunit 5 (subunit L)/multisubunit Na+/H+ antiporter MnhA subunit